MRSLGVYNIYQPSPSRQTSFPFTRNFVMTLHVYLLRNCYAMCTQKAPNNFADQLYSRYGNIYEDYLKDRVLPAIKAKQGESPMLQEFATRWKNHKLLVRQMWKLFVYLVSAGVSLPSRSSI